jgi:putative transposase
MIKRRPPRLDFIYAEYPVYFITFCTRNRNRIPSLELAMTALEKYGHRGADEFGTALGRYVIMPNHVHLFVSGHIEFVLSPWVGGLKRAMSVALGMTHFWQPGFFDHVLRSDDSYSQKWEYVRANPVRAGLVTTADDWPYQGEIVSMDRAKL